ncbi:MAG: EamA family transporter RarD [Bacteriovoracaceae bacterium]|jgi:chloramphenicol-sensitive protein RarD|nr:EamA family transporter RarD [Bacteriovoracaceae bacterium]
MNPLIHGILAFSMWGVLPLYLKQIAIYNIFEITAYRIIFSLLSILILFSFIKKNRVGKVLSLRNIFSSFLIGVNWFLFVVAVEQGRIIEASFGYFGGPIISILIGAFYFKEKISNLKKIAVFIALISILIQSSALNTFPTIAISLAITFSLYGAMKKTSKLDSIVSLYFESLLLTVPAIIYLLVTNKTTYEHINIASFSDHLFIMGSGIMTVAPLYFFTKAAKKLDLNVLGFLQYLAPSLQFLIGYTIYNEPLNNVRLLSFTLIWLASIFIIFDLKKVKK